MKYEINFGNNSGWPLLLLEQTASTAFGVFLLHETRVRFMSNWHVKQGFLMAWRMLGHHREGSPEEQRAADSLLDLPYFRWCTELHLISLSAV